MNNTSLPKLCLALLLGAQLQGQAFALTDRQHLQKWCTGESAAAAGRCIGYLLAAEDALATGSVEGVRACLPEKLNLREQHQIVLDWLDQNPQAESSTALGLVARAYARHYPCRD